MRYGISAAAETDFTTQLQTRARETGTRLAWDEETLGAAPRRATISAPVAEKISGIRLLNGTTQVQLLPGVTFPDDVKVACPPVKRIVVVRVHVGEPFDALRLLMACGWRYKMSNVPYRRRSSHGPEPVEGHAVCLHSRTSVRCVVRWMCQ